MDTNAKNVGKPCGRVSKPWNRKPNAYGTRIATIAVDPDKRPFAIHENLICAYSAHFKDRFQMNRRDIDDECAICHEEMIGAFEDIRYCSSCGYNYHCGCILSWLDRNAHCPYCQSQWQVKPRKSSATCDNIDPQLFAAFIQWVYEGQIPSYSKEDRGSDECYLRVVKTFALGGRLGAPEFQRALLFEMADIINDTGKLPGALVLKFVYKHVPPGSPLHTCLAWHYVHNIGTNLLNRSDLPIELLRDIARGTIERWKMKERPDRALEGARSAAAGASNIGAMTGTKDQPITLE